MVDGREEDFGSEEKNRGDCFSSSAEERVVADVFALGGAAAAQRLLLGKARARFWISVGGFS